MFTTTGLAAVAGEEEDEYGGGRGEDSYAEEEEEAADEVGSNNEEVLSDVESDPTPRCRADCRTAFQRSLERYNRLRLLESSGWNR